MHETLETVKTTPELQQFAEKLESFGATIVEREKAVFSRTSGDKFQVLCHGDLWINNLFFKFNDDREAVDAIMVRNMNEFKLIKCTVVVVNCWNLQLVTVMMINRREYLRFVVFYF